jgi:glycine amidinotransferase
MKIINSYNEWDLLEEVIVGRLDRAMLPTWQTIARATVPPDSEYLQQRIKEREKGPSPYPPEKIEAGKKDLAEFIRILEGEGVKVRQPDPYPFSESYSTPHWQVNSGFCSANPRDVFLVIGDEIIEAPMAHRDRHYEAHAYRSILKDYFAQGARWTAAPKPQLLDDLYDANYKIPGEGEELRYVTTEFEPTFDAADFVRCGKDIFVQRSHVTNKTGIEWLRRHLGNEYRIHEVKTKCRQSMHIDTTFMPMAPGKLLYNPQFLDYQEIPEFVRKQWDIFECPTPVITDWQKKIPVSQWINMNFLMLDEERILVEELQVHTIQAFKDWGFKPIPCPFFNYYIFGGSFHCATLDIRRQGTLQSYFDIT